MSEPSVSVLIPTYNGERHLRAALRSAREQSHRALEILIGDDGSTDGTAQIVATAAAADDRIRVIRHETNVGAYDNLSGLLREARGEYVKYLLHDDVLATDCVRELVRGMQSAPEATLAFSRRSLIDENGKAVPGHEFPALRDRAGTIDGLELGDSVLETCTNDIGEFSTALFRRDALDLDTLWEVDGRRIDVVTDVKVWIQLLARGPAFYTPRTLSRFRLHPGQNTWNPWAMARGERDWVRLVDWGIRQGFLRDPAQRRRAYSRVLQMAAARLASMVDSPEHGPALETVFLATTALVELGADRSGDAQGPLWRRAHGPGARYRFTQQLDVWTRTYPVALAAPSLAPEELTATVEALRRVAADGVAEKLVIAVPPHLLEEAVPLLEEALAQGPDIDVELVPSDAPATLLRAPWLAVAPPDRRWHADLATAVWSLEPAGVPSAAS
ncbi:glycosyltransferase family 2 protein [Modestobacter muralis]|uniref:Glycosyltransferase family 2 protein n=1 Tax=Modestobacter muralis TaxID=1608614 RepID=A0A6P0ET65_9ACTN|nr:glycosyltransferase family 2 protein [Modestobacter muralis]NEN51819.1 glycosyltransferase family 2 protein [Modestobacter muralis]